MLSIKIQVWYDSPHSTHPPMTPPNNNKKKKNPKSNELEAWQHHTERHRYKYNSLLSSNGKGGCAPTLERHRVALLHCWMWYFWFLVQQKVVVCGLGLTSLNVSTWGGQLNPTWCVIGWWKHPVSIMLTKVIGHQPVWPSHPKNTVHTPTRRHTHHSNTWCTFSFLVWL